MTSLSAREMTPQNFVTIALLMSICIIWGMVLSVIFNKGYLKKLQKNTKKGSSQGGFGDHAMSAMFIGLVSAYIGATSAALFLEMVCLLFPEVSFPLS